MSSKTSATWGGSVVPVERGLFSTPSSSIEEPYLVGSKCRSCGEVLFPTRPICPYCFKKDTEQVGLSRRGKLHTFTVVRRQPAFYRGPVPYCIGYVELPEVRVIALLTGCDVDELKIGMDMELVIEKLYQDEEGHEVVTYKFRPV